MLEREFKYFRDNQNELVKKYLDKYIGIVGEEVKGAYDDVGTAYQESIKLYKPGSFLIQQCKPGKDAYTQTFHSRVRFDHV